ncbi:hypothetical protein V5N11_002259 [Cardamine amara subsp. amara]|uniref:DUF1216 domain-containing protein n=1 Tax=Cardamine amara subsp. amara TaxID=228776 RepID=A0ABD1ABV6_CARAN
MARIQLLLCFTILLASVTLLDVVSAHLKIKPTLPEIEDPKTVKDVEPYTVKVVMVFVSDLEKECPKTNYDKDMKAKAGGLLKTISSFAVGKIREEIQEEKQEAINTFKFLRFVAAKILGGGKNDENKETMTLTAEQQKEIKEGILRWQTIMTKITNTMVVSTTSSSPKEDSTGGKESSNGKSESSGGSSYKGSTGSAFNKGAGAPSESPSNSPSGSTSFKDTTGGVMISPSGSMTIPSGSPMNSPSGSGSISPSGSMTIPSGSPMNSPSGSGSISPTQSGSSTKGSDEVSQNSTMTVTEVEAETSKEVMTFIMNLEKKCPQKEEYKSFFEKLKATMTAPPKVAAKGIKGFLSGVKSAGGKLSEAMTFMRSRIGSKSAEVKKSLEDYQGEVMKTIQELETIHSQIVNQNKDKKDGSLTVTTEQRTEIKKTITKWEQVTTQFVETAIQSETQTSSPTLGNSLGKINLPNAA